ncbi:histidine kinase [Flavicella sediminum]|uniref:histidine kinase n=1 Tax=Flavicella sediminum TaxID=2585141 RepID=UPI00111C994A|nr:histidine kinase [Flavicella sediminum]
MHRLLKNLLLTFIIGVVAFVTSNYFFGKFEFASTKDLWIDFGMNQLFSFVIGFSNLYFFYYLEQRTWKENAPWRRVITGVLGSVVITIICLFLLRLFGVVYVNNVSFLDFLANEKLRYYTFGVWITLSIVITFHVIYFYKKNQERKIKESQIVAKTETAKFESLKNQLDPHFLFNSLNVLTSLIEESPKKAEKFTTKLSKVYRYVLEQKDKDLISLEEELRFAKSYMELLQMRFEDALHFELPQEISNSELKIVPLSLQLLLENAVKHNVITSKNPLTIKIYESFNYLVVENNCSPKTSIEKSTKVGLKNIKNRYELISKDQVEIHHDEKLFKVKLPLLTQKIKKMETNYISDSNKYLKAKKRVDELKGFYWSLASYIVVIPFLAFINYSTYWGYKWFYYPMCGWGVGILIQAISVFLIGNGWEERKIKELMNKDKY